MRRLAAVTLMLLATATPCAAQLRRNYYAGVPSSATHRWRHGAPLLPRLLHGGLAGCDASVIVASTANNTAEKDNPVNLSLAGDGFDTVIKAKAAVDTVPQCRNRVSCADILAMATRDAIALAGGPSYAVELGRLDGLSSTASSVNGKLAPPTFNLDQLTALFATNGLSQTDMIALSAGTVGFAHCNTIQFHWPDPWANTGPFFSSFAAQLRTWCPPNVDPRIAVTMDVVTPRAFDNQYFKNLQNMGLLASDQVLHSDLVLSKRAGLSGRARSTQSLARPKHGTAR
ncbi:hypothetical protein EJB05_13767, partial [Eragrostis curvula]